MIGCILVFIAWSLLMICLGIHFNSKLDANYIEMLENSRDFHKDQKAMFVDESRAIVKENHSLRKMNDQLIQENKQLKKELDKQTTTTYNVFY